MLQLCSNMRIFVPKTFFNIIWNPTTTSFKKIRPKIRILQIMLCGRRLEGGGDGDGDPSWRKWRSIFCRDWQFFPFAHFATLWWFSHYLQPRKARNYGQEGAFSTRAWLSEKLCRSEEERVLAHETVGSVFWVGKNLPVELYRLIRRYMDSLPLEATQEIPVLTGIGATVWFLDMLPPPIPSFLKDSRINLVS